MKLSRLIPLYLDSLSVAPETLLAYSSKLRVAVVRLDDPTVSLIRAEHFDRLRVSLVRARLSPFYIRGILRTFKTLLVWAYRRRYLRVDVAALVRVPSPALPDPKPIDSATFRALLRSARLIFDEADRCRAVAFLMLLRDSGGRLGGLLNANVSSVDFARGYITAMSKGRLVRLYFNKRAAAALRSWLEVHPSGAGALFVSLTSGARLTRAGVYHLLNRLAVAAGVEGQRYNPHSFRHAFARDMLRAGADLSEVSQLMGHSSIRVTADYYARWTPDELGEVHRRKSPLR